MPTNRLRTTSVQKGGGWLTSHVCARVNEDMGIVIVMHACMGTCQRKGMSSRCCTPHPGPLGVGHTTIQVLPFIAVRSHCPCSRHYWHTPWKARVTRKWSDDSITLTHLVLSWNPTISLIQDRSLAVVRPSPLSLEYTNLVIIDCVPRNESQSVFTYLAYLPYFLFVV
jgi:hypothetical protein